MVGQLRLKPHIEHWEGDDEVTFYAANVQRPCDLSDLAAASSSSSSSSNSSSSDLSGSGDGLQNSNAANEVLDALRSRSDSCTFPESKDVKVHPFMLRIGKIISNVPFSVGTLITVSAVSFLLGTLAVMVVKPSPQWDKSLDAFQIPNHPSTLKREMLELAQKDNHVPKRPKRRTFEPPARLGELDLKDSTINEYGIDFKHMSNIHKRHIKTKLSYPKKAGVDLPENVFNPIHSDHLLDINKKLVHRNQQDNNQLVQKDQNLQVNSANQNTNSANKRSSSVSNSSTVKEDTQGHIIKRRSAGLVPQAHSWRLQLVYMAKGEDENIFTPERLQTIHDIEMDIMKQPGFTRFCSRSSHSIDDPALARFGHCLPQNSLMTYFFPTQVGDMIRYDGMGTELADINHLKWR